MEDLTSKVVVLENENKVLKEKNLKLTQQLEKQTQRHREIEKRLAIHPVSGLPTHYQMNQELVAFLDERRAFPEQLWAFILVQLNHTYEMIKRTLKSSISEWVLYQLSDRLNELIQDDELLYHTRENEFLIVHQYENLNDLKAYLKLLSMKIREPHIFSGFNLTLESHFGVAAYPQDAIEKSTLLHHADIALGIAQEQNSPFVIYQTELQDQVIEKMELQNSIIKAIEAPALREIAHQFELFFQPKLFLSSVKPDGASVSRIAAEVLMRWNHPTRGQIPPSKFIPIAEETGLIMPIGKWSIFQVVKKMAQWKDTVLGDIQLSINISPRQFRSTELIEILEKAVAQNDIVPEFLTLEVTETSLFEDPFVAMQFLGQFKNLGMKISVDDFGTGYSSLSHLHKFTLDEIKIDQSFTREFPENPQDRAIIRSLTSIAKELNLEIVAEGVERSEQVVELFSLGCHCIQGFVFSKPLNEEGFLRFVTHLKENNMQFPFQ